MPYENFKLAKPVGGAESSSGVNEDAIQAQLNRELYERGGIATLVMLILITLMRWAIDPACQVDTRIGSLFVVLVVINVVRWFLAMIPATQRDAILNQDAQYLVFAAGVGLSATMLGGLVVMTWPLLETARISILAITGRRPKGSCKGNTEPD